MAKGIVSQASLDNQGAPAFCRPGGMIGVDDLPRFYTMRHLLSWAQDQLHGAEAMEANRRNAGEASLDVGDDPEIEPEDLEDMTAAEIAAHAERTRPLHVAQSALNNAQRLLDRMLDRPGFTDQDPDGHDFLSNIVRAGGSALVVNSDGRGDTASRQRRFAAAYVVVASTIRDARRFGLPATWGGDLYRYWTAEAA